jgi:hypothetical protein
MKVAYCSLIAPLTIVGNTTGPPADHVVHFQGAHFPCDAGGQDLKATLWNAGEVVLADGLVSNFTFSAKPPEPYQTYYDKMVAYVGTLGKYAARIDEDATAITFRVPTSDEEEDPIFLYPETASARAGIDAIADKLALQKVVIVGLGGTGAYILDFVAKTRVKEIHLYDDDVFAFRSPGATQKDELFRVPALRKVEYLAEKYAAMRRGIVPHPKPVDASNSSELMDADFVFLSLDPSDAKRAVVQALVAAGRPFIDVGMSADRGEGSVGGLLRMTLSTQDKRDHRVGVSLSAMGDDDYNNVQIAELNALNAVMAVIKWKKHFGFYQDSAQEYSSVYTIENNELLNDDFLGPADHLPS